ncbi:MBL fold metallo-hydrolase [Paeniglutamicibacter sp. ABSL32-1]|uniref:MBL fold metallo-hydrolase n=1 Tax=Paeniglutamicibacter quisquiliarum TaxID=2849498 RepID=UPI001C2CCE23|nr:MBL fold metallo-hydrolase [Paeniglutamicibacter quisquiliarum]MBV1779618.1 MBL fold metallo-hydrolase [Paeniglutamicibacter quisquiliarum]
MEIIKFNHACIRVQESNRALAIDPGDNSPLGEALEGIEAILVTHEHADHLDLGPVLRALAGNPALTLHAPGALAATVRAAAAAAGVPDAEGRIHGVGPGATFRAAGMEISTHGGMHAVIHHALPVVQNLGYFIAGRLYHPGDSYQVPEGIAVETLLVPAHAPWAKIGETIEFMSIIGAAQNFPIHDGLLNERGLALVDGHLGRVAAERGLDYRRIPNGRAVSLGS